MMSKMKKKTIALIFTIGFLFIIVGYDYFFTKRYFKQAIYGVLLNLNYGNSLRNLLDDYYFEYGQYPKCLKEIDSLYYGLNNFHDTNIRSARKKALMDPFAKNESYYFYKPVYDNKTMLRESYIALSRGIDRKINNKFLDTVYLVDSLYIRNYLFGKYFNSSENILFNYFDKYFGKKDYNLNPFLTTGRDLMEMQINGCITVKQLIKNMDEGINWKVACIKCAKNGLVAEKRGFYYNENGIEVVFNLKTNIPETINQDSVCILGTVVNKVQKNRITINNAFIYNPPKPQ